MDRRPRLRLSGIEVRTRSGVTRLVPWNLLAPGQLTVLVSRPAQEIWPDLPRRLFLPSAHHAHAARGLIERDIRRRLRDGTFRAIWRPRMTMLWLMTLVSFALPLALAGLRVSDPDDRLVPPARLIATLGGLGRIDLLVVALVPLLAFSVAIGLSCLASIMLVRMLVERRRLLLVRADSRGLTVDLRDGTSRRHAWRDLCLARRAVLGFDDVRSAQQYSFLTDPETVDSRRMISLIRVLDGEYVAPQRVAGRQAPAPSLLRHAPPVYFALADERRCCRGCGEPGAPEFRSGGTGGEP